MRELMLDIECLGKPPTGALAGIGAMFFDTATRQKGPTFYRTVHLATAVRDGGTMDPSTVLWWLGQSDEARKAIRFGGLDVRQVLQEFSDWIKETCRHEDVLVYGNASGFDCTLVGGAYERARIKTPWHYVNERCFRTIRSRSRVEYDPAKKGDGAHNALADAVFQVEHMFAMADAVQKARDGRA